MSIPVAQTSTFTLEAYTIKQQPMFGNRAFAVFLIFLKGQLIGRQCSYPCVSDCQWWRSRNGVYAHEHESHRHSGGYIARSKWQDHGKKKGVGVRFELKVRE